MANPANGVVENFAGRERLVTTLVGHNPQTGTEETLHECIASPQSGSYWCRRNVLRCDEAVGEVEDGAKRKHVSGDIVQTCSSRSLEAVLGNSFVDVTNGVVWDVEFIAVRINELWLFLQLFAGLDSIF